MRLRLIIALFLVAGAVVVGLFLRSRAKENLNSSSIPAPSILEQSTNRNKFNRNKFNAAPKAPEIKSHPSQKNITNSQEIASTNDVLIKLQEFSQQEDPKYLTQILVHLTNSDPDIRKAALEATMQFGSRDAIPALKELASKTDDPREKVEISDAIEFLELPPFSEIRKRREK
jgi:hypothetical protein